MMRPTTLVLFVLSVVSGGALFGVAFEVSALEERLFALNKEITSDREAIHVLRAEWSYLNQPERLEGLSQRYLELQPLEGNQLAVIAAVPATPESALAPTEVATVEATAVELPLSGTLAARPKAKPAAPHRPNRQARPTVQKASHRTAPTPGMTASESAALDASLQAILGTTADSAGGARR